MKLRRHQITLRGERVILRPMTEEDFELLVKWNSDPEVVRLTDGIDTPRRPDDIRGIYEATSQNAFCFMIEAGGQPIGEGWLQRMNLPRLLEKYPGKDCRRIDLMIGDKSCWGRGFGPEVIGVLSRFAFEGENADMVFGCALPHNCRSISAFQKAGWRLDGQTAEVCDMMITREEHLDRRWRRMIDQGLVPPEEIRVGVGPFRDSARYLEWGQHTCRRLADLGGMMPDDAILDLGCGCGRIAIHIAGYLSPSGRYDGLDNSPEMAGWCRDNLDGRWPNVQFHFCDVRSGYGNPNGTIRPGDFRFPFPNASFTFVFAESLFTHMFLDDCRAYLSEAARVLKPGGRLYATYFLLSAASRKGIASHRAFRDFRFQFGASLSFDGTVAEEGIAHPEEDIRRAYASLPLRTTRVEYGNWSESEPSFPVPFQDTILAQRL